MPSSASFLKAVRLIHLYIGVFIAPALLFFAFTGFVQTFSLHETTRGSSYKPPAILVKLGQLHKKQTLVVPVRKPQPAAAPTADKPHDAVTSAGAPVRPTDGTAPKPDAAKPDGKQTWPIGLALMKLFFALVSIGLFTSTLTGIYMSYKYRRGPVLITALLVAGIVLPVLFTFFE